MAKTDLMAISVNLTREAVQELHVISQVYRKQVGQLIRDAVDEHIQKLTATEEFRTTAKALQEQHTQTIEKLLKGPGPEEPPPNSGKSNVRRFPRNPRPRKR